MSSGCVGGGGLLAEETKDVEVEYLCGPATGGLVVAQWTALAAGKQALFAEHALHHRSDELRGQFELRRGYDRCVHCRNLLVVVDADNSGHSVRQTAEAVRRAGGEVVAAAAIVDRGNVDAERLGVPSVAAFRATLFPSGRSMSSLPKRRPHQYPVRSWTGLPRCPPAAGDLKDDYYVRIGCRESIVK